MEEEAARSWELIQQLRGLHPTLDPWRQTNRIKAKAAANPEITTLEEFLAVMHANIKPDLSGVRFSLFSGDVDRADGASIMVRIGGWQPDTGGVRLEFHSSEFADLLVGDESLADRLVAMGADILDPEIGGLSREDHPVKDHPEPYDYTQGWKMFFPASSPHWAQAGALATASYPTANGAVFTYGTPDTYPTILDTWPKNS
ncbi:Hypothetical protein PROPJV5_1634 [Propionibacterium ruminifibrarum]|uniref:Uncharacterized protein n=1 Tax=Propionibacterium ruminifibrarum TaxID=1962131 RepID=A0A375I5I8_9ACTN|nr:hypothetical protein [Propionibacterium ruminifibrarum]SPF68652.1 Hypothetical protein PROPJV5_1634 [Propionibacterium ruminifibrarum]